MGRTLILSDFHLGRPNSRLKSVEQIRPLWQGYDSLILNGDTAELHSTTHSELSKQLTLELLEAANDDHVITTVICGNHDPTLSEIDHLLLCDNQVLVLHGHVMFEGFAPWSWRNKHVASCRQTYIKEHGDGFTEQLLSMRHAAILSATGAYSQHRPSAPKLLFLALPAIWNIFQSWRKFPTLSETWVARYAPEVKFIITGHTHRAGIWFRNGRTIINTGCFGFPSHPRAVSIDDNKLVVHKLKLVQGNYSLGGVCMSWNDL